MKNLESLSSDVAIMLDNYRVSYRHFGLKNLAEYYQIEDFGLIVCVFNRIDYTQVSGKMTEHYSGWRVNYITTDDNLVEKKYEVLWDLMRCGYMKWLRWNFPRQVRSILMGPDNLGSRIIEERLRIWDNKPKYKFLIEDNISVQRNGIIPELSKDPSFFDYMPEVD